MTDWKKGITAFLCTCLAGVPLFFSLWFLVSQQVAWIDMEERLEQGHLQTIAVLKSDVHWVKPGKEIRIRGKMFDVKSQSEKGDSLYFTGLFDNEEDLLYEQFRNTTDGFEEEQSSKLYAQTLLLLFVELNFATSLPAAITDGQKRYGSNTAFLPFVSTAKPGPPPKC